MARATSSLLRSPCESAEAGSSAWSAIPTNSRASIALASIFRTQSPRACARGASNGTITFATMGRWRKGRVFWKVQAIPRFTTSHVLSEVMSSPLKITRPLSGFSTRVIRRSSVVCPAPLGPIRPTIWSRRSSKLTSLTASRPPKRRERRSARKNGGPIITSRASRGHESRLPPPSFPRHRRVGVPPLAARDLAHIGAGQLSAKFDHLWHLVFGEPLAAIRLDLLLVHLAARIGLEDHDGLDPVAERRVGNADHPRRLHLRMRVEHLLDVLREDRVPLALDHVLAAGDEAAVA